MSAIPERPPYRQSPNRRLAAEHPDLYPPAQRMVESMVGYGGCELVSDDRMDRCEQPTVGVRFEDGFLDVICEFHALRAEGRGALVVRPKERREHA